MRKTTAKQSNKMSRTNNNVEITVQNAENEPDTKATILVQNQIDFEPKVSVIIPVYNVEEYLRQCLDSVINQTLKEIEIICVDDGSTDSSLEILKEYAAKDHRITVITQQNNGAAIARNIGLYNINANYIGFIDADDYIDLDFYEKLLNMAIKTNADIVKSNAKIIDCDLTTRFDDAQISNIRLYGKWRFLYQWWTGLYKANIIKNNNIKFPDKIISSQDIVFLTYCVIYANKIELCPNTFYHYLRHPDSLDGQVLSYEKILSKISAIKIISKLYNNINIPKDEYIYCYHQRWILLKSFLLLYFIILYMLNPKPRKINTIVPIQKSIRFFIMMLPAFFALVNPVSTIANPACIKNTNAAPIRNQMPNTSVPTVLEI